MSEVKFVTDSKTKGTCGDYVRWNKSERHILDDFTYYVQYKETKHINGQDEKNRPVDFNNRTDIIREEACMCAYTAYENDLKDDCVF